MYSNNLLLRKYLLIYSSGNSYLYICTYVRSSDLTSQWPAVHHPNKNIVSVQNDNKQRILNETFKTRHCLRVPKRFWANASDADYINKCFDPCQFEVLYIVLIYLYILSYSIITISPAQYPSNNVFKTARREKGENQCRETIIFYRQLDWSQMMEDEIQYFHFSAINLNIKNKICVCYQATYLGSFFGYIYVVVKKVHMWWHFITVKKIQYQRRGGSSTGGGE